MLKSHDWVKRFNQFRPRKIKLIDFGVYRIRKTVLEKIP